MPHQHKTALIALAVAAASITAATAPSDRHSASAAVATDRSSCPPRGATVLRTFPKVRVYRSIDITYRSSFVYACVRGRRGRSYIGVASGAYAFNTSAAPRGVAARGTRLAFVTYLPQDDESSPPFMQITQMDAPFPRDGTGLGGAFFPGDAPRAVGAMVLAPNGTVMLTSCQPRYLDPLRLGRGCRRNSGARLLAAPDELFAPGARLDARVLASRRSIDPSSLRLSPSGTHFAYDDGDRRVVQRVP